VEAGGDQKAETAGGHGILRWVWIAGLAVVLYVLSIGPVVRLSYRYAIVDASLDVIYAPLTYFAYNSRAASRFLKWYIEDAWGATGATGL
jgi:hypothetical protein